MGRPFKFVFAFQPGPGHWSRLGAIAARLRERGHHVVIATSEAFRRRLDSSSYDDFWAIGPSWEEDRLEAGDFPPPRGMVEELKSRSGAIASFFFGAAAQVAADLTRALQQGSRPDLIVFDYTLLGGPPAAEALGLPWATVFGLTVPFSNPGWPPFGSHLGLARSPAIRREYELIERSIIRENRQLYRPLGDLWRAAGRRLQDPWRAYARLGRLGIVGSIPACEFPLPQKFPPQIHYVGPLLGREHDSTGLDEEAAAFVRPSADPLIHLTLGMTFSRAGAILQRLIRALGDEPLRLLISSGHLDPRWVQDGCGGGAAPLLVRPTVPHLQVIPRVAALICHGGSGTLMKALYFGAPVLVIPLGAEQRSNGARLVHAGIGKMILPARLSPPGIRNAVRGLLDPARGYLKRAREMGELARRAGGAQFAATLLEKVCEP